MRSEKRIDFFRTPLQCLLLNDLDDRVGSWVDDHALVVHHGERVGGILRNGRQSHGPRQRTTDGIRSCSTTVSAGTGCCRT